MNSKQFIILLQTKPNKAIYYLYRKSAPIKNWIKANSGNKSEADDILQDGVTILYQNLSKPHAKLTTAPEYYLMGICKNLWFSELRKQKRIPKTNLDESLLSLPEEMQLENGFPVDQVAHLLKELGSKCHELLNLFYYQKRSMQFIAEKLNFRNDKVAKAMKYKCLIKARKLIIEKK